MPTKRITKIQTAKMEREISGVIAHTPVRLDSNGIVKAGAKAGSNIRFLRRWSKTNEGEFARVMKAIAKENPVKWAQIYMSVQDKIVPQKTVEKTIATKIDVKLDNNEEMNRLQSLAAGKSPLTFKKNFTDYEEVDDDDDDD